MIGGGHGVAELRLVNLAQEAGPTSTVRIEVSEAMQDWSPSGGMCSAHSWRDHLVAVDAPQTIVGSQHHRCAMATPREAPTPAGGTSLFASDPSG